MSSFLKNILQKNEDLLGTVSQEKVFMDDTFIQVTRQGTVLWDITLGVTSNYVVLATGIISCKSCISLLSTSLMSSTQCLLLRFIPRDNIYCSVGKTKEIIVIQTSECPHSVLYFKPRFRQIKGSPHQKLDSFFNLLNSSLNHKVHKKGEISHVIHGSYLDGRWDEINLENAVEFSFLRGSSPTARRLMYLCEKEDDFFAAFKTGKFIVEKKNSYPKDEPTEIRKKVMKKRTKMAEDSSLLNNVVSRFGKEVDDPCIYKLLLLDTNTKDSRRTWQDLYTLADNCLSIWEEGRNRKYQSTFHLEHFQSYPLLEAVLVTQINQYPSSISHLRKWNSVVYLKEIYPISIESSLHSKSYPVKSVSLDKLDKIFVPDKIKTSILSSRGSRRTTRQLSRNSSSFQKYLLYRFSVTCAQFWMTNNRYIEHLEIMKYMDGPGSFNKNKGGFNNLDASSVAEELSSINTKLFLALDSTELTRVFSEPKSVNMQTCPNFIRLLDFSHRVVNLVTTEIIRQPYVTGRAQVLHRFIEILTFVLSLQDYHSAVILLAGIQSPPVYCLFRTYHELQDGHCEAHKMYLEVCKLLKRNTRLKKLQTSETWILPYIGDVLLCLHLEASLNQVRPSRRWNRFDSLAEWIDSEVLHMQALYNKKKSNPIRKIPWKRKCFQALSKMISLGHFKCLPMHYLEVDSIQHNNESAKLCSERTDKNESSTQQNQHLRNVSPTMYYLFSPPPSLLVPHCCALYPQKKRIVKETVSKSLDMIQSRIAGKHFVSTQRTRKFLLFAKYSEPSENFQRSIEVKFRKGVGE